MLVAQTTRPVQKNRLRDELTRATVRTDTVDGVGQREKEGKEARKREQPGPALEKGERQLKSAKIEVISCGEEKYRFWKRGEKEKKKRREREESDKSGDRTYGGSAEPAHPPRC